MRIHFILRTSTRFVAITVGFIICVAINYIAALLAKGSAQTTDRRTSRGAVQR